MGVLPVEGNLAEQAMGMRSCSFPSTPARINPVRDAGKKGLFPGEVVSPYPPNASVAASLCMQRIPYEAFPAGFYEENYSF